MNRSRAVLPFWSVLGLSCACFIVSAHAQAPTPGQAPPAIQTDDPAARSLYQTFLGTVRSARSLSWESSYRFSAGGQEGICSYRIWLKKPGLGRMEATMPGEVTGAEDKVTGAIVGDGESFWIYWPAGFPGTRSWDPGHPDKPEMNLYMQRQFVPERYSFSHDSRQLGACMVMLAFQPSVFHGQEDTPQAVQAVAPLGTESIDGQSCRGVLLSMADGQRTAEYWLSEQDQLPRRIKAVAHAGQDIVIEETWTSILLNKEMPDSLFQWKPPEGFVEYFEPILESELLPVGVDAPEFRASLLDGGFFRLSEQRGKIVLLNFFRIGCPPCRTELPLLERLHQSLSPKGLVVLGYDESDDRTRLSSLLESKGVTYPCALDTTDAGSRYRIGYTASDRGSADPLNYLIDRDGKVAARWFGYSEQKLLDALSRVGLKP